MIYNMDFINFDLRMANKFKQEAIQFKLDGHIKLYNLFNKISEYFYKSAGFKQNYETTKYKYKN